MDTQLLVIEEAGAWKDPGAVADEFKDFVQKLEK